MAAHAGGLPVTAPQEPSRDRRRKCDMTATVRSVHDVAGIAPPPQAPHRVRRDLFAG